MRDATLLGHYTVLNTYCGGSPTPEIYGFITAENCDEIHTKVYESGGKPEVGVYYRYNILGGTG